MSSRPTFPEEVAEPAHFRSVPETDPLSSPTAPNGEAASDDASLPGPRTINLFDSGAKTAGGDQASVAGYDILKELGRGGMGTVYCARQRSLNRLVALKMIRSGVQAEARELGRFWSEAEAVARLQHPHIVQIHEVGEQNGCPYFSLELLLGGSLADKIAGAPQPARWSAQLVETLAEAMHYAHERGIIHRDLKPANVLLTAGGTPKISDFGLAKLLERETPSGDCGAPRLPVRAPTEAGIVIGTPSYMAPEQAAGQNPSIGPATDVYALGAVLYEMLTGRPPFRGEGPMETVLQVLNNEPVPPRRLRPKLPRDLETICLKCLEKKPRRRYASADALAADLRRFLDGAPIQARPVWIWERALKSAKRQPAKATLIAVLLLAGFVALVGGWLYSRQLSGHNQALKAALNDADDSARKRGRDLYVSRMNNAQRAWHEGRVGRVLELLDLYANPDATQEDLRGFEWYYLRRQCHCERLTLRGHASWVSSVALSRDGKHIASAAGDGAVTLWDAATGREVRTLRGHRGEVTSVAFSPNGGTLASAGTDGTVRLWSPGNGDALLVFRKHGGPVGSVTFAPDGTTLASCGEGTSGPAVVKIWDITGRVIRDLPSPEQAISCVAFSPDGLHLATAHAKPGKSTTVKIWEVATGKLGLILDNAGRKIAFDPTGARLATAGPEQPVRVWDARTGQLVLTLQGLNGLATGVAFSPDGRRLACAAGDLGDVGEVKVWDLTAGREARTLRGHVGPVWAVAFSPDGRCLVSAGHDRTLKVWDLAADPELRQLSHHAGPVTGLACTRDGRLVSASQDGTVSVWGEKGSRVLRGDGGDAGSVNAAAAIPYDEQAACARRAP